MKYKTTHHFDKDIQRLDPKLVDAILKTISEVVDNFGKKRKRSLKIEKINGFWSARVNDNFRVIFKVEDDVIIFHRATNHDIYKRRSK